MSDPGLAVKVTKVSAIKDISSPSHHVGNPPKSYMNPWPSFRKSTPFEMASGFFSNRDFKPIPPQEQLVPVQKPDWGVGKPGLKATWIGHASFLVETPVEPGAERGVRILFDPVFSERTSPFSFAGPKRYNPTPCEIDELPDVDLVVISHDHYDHMDSDTLSKVYARRRGEIHFLVALGSASRLKGFGIDEKAITELDWWGQVNIDVGKVGSITMICTPSQHGSGRGVLDQYSTLWCSWVLETAHDADEESKSQKLFFAGDTGYRYVAKGADENEVPRCPVFQEIGESLGPFDLCLLPIGLYAPRHLLSRYHCSPEDAVCLHKDLKSKKSIGMHYGTVRGGFSQYFEEVTEPPRRFREACEKEGGKWGEDMGLMNIGETIVI